MNERLPRHAEAFMDLVARLEHALRRHGYAREDRDIAFIDWARFARELGDDFFRTVRESGEANVLIGEPPRSYYRNRGFMPRNSKPIETVRELITRGVIQVRNNIAHGEKYVERATRRDDDLTKEALWVLRTAISSHPEVKHMMAAQET